MMPPSSTGVATMIRQCTAADAPGVHAIYNHHVLHTTVTFEIAPVSIEEIARRIETVTARYPWLVWIEDDVVAGYSYAAEWRSRCAFAQTVESAIYVGEAYQRRGIARALYTALLDRLREQGIHCVIAGLGLPNPASEALHAHLGFREVGRFHDVGRKFDRWLDLAYWQLLIDDTMLK
jgi:phosphinothricin acetyltransferase